MTDTVVVIQSTTKTVEVITQGPQGPLPSDAEIKTGYEANADTNAFTDAEKTKLTGIETAATADQTNTEIKTAYEANADTNAFTDADVTTLAGKVDKAGDTMTGALLLPDGTDAAPGLSFSADTNTGFRRAGGRIVLVIDGTDTFDFANSKLTMPLNHALGWTSAGAAVNAQDLSLHRDAANTLAQRNGTNAQDFRLYGTFTDTVNHERLSIKHQFGLITFASQSAGTGISRDFQFTGGAVQSDKSVTITGTSSTAGFRINDGLGNFNRVLNRDSAGGIVFMGDIDNSSDQVRIRAGGVDSATFLVDGNVGIGTTGPSEKLHVSGGKVLIDGTASKLTVGGGAFPGPHEINIVAAGVSLDAAYQLSGDDILWTNTSNSSLIHLSSRDSSTGQLAFETGVGQVERMRIDAGGNVGIGIAAAVSLLHVKGPEGVAITVEGPNDALGKQGIQFRHTSTSAAGYIGTITKSGGGAGSLIFSTQTNSAGEAMRITDAGKVGIGISAPVSQLHVFEGNSDTSSTAGITIEQNGAGDAIMQFLLTGQQRFVMGIDNSDLNKFKISSDLDLASNNVLTIDVAGLVGIGTTAPGAKLDVVGAIRVTDGTLSGISAGMAMVNETSVGGQIQTFGSLPLILNPLGNNVGIGDTVPTSKLTVKNTNTTVAVLINQDGNGDSLRIDPESTTAHVIQILGAKQTTGDVLRLRDADALTTGHIINAHSNSASTSTRDLVKITNDNVLATGTTALRIEQDSSGRAIFIDVNGEGTGLEIDTEAVGQVALNINDPKTVTSTVFRVANCNALTTGTAAFVHSASASTTSRNVMLIQNANPLATGATALTIRQDSAQRALFIDQNGNHRALEINSAATTFNGNAINSVSSSTSAIGNDFRCDALTTGIVARFISNSASTSTRTLFQVVNDNTAATGTTALTVIQDAANEAIQLLQNAASSYINYRGTAAGNATDPISTLTTSGGTTHHIQIEINGVKAWIAVSTTDPTA